MSVTQVLVTRCPNAPLLECGFIKILTLVATNSEGKSSYHFHISMGCIFCNMLFMKNLRMKFCCILRALCSESL